MSKQIKYGWDKLRITRSEDKRNWIYQELHEGGLDRKNGKPASPRWVDIGYYGRLDHIIQAILNRSIYVPDDSMDGVLKAILEELKRVEKSLLEQMKVVE